MESPSQPFDARHHHDQKATTSLEIFDKRDDNPLFCWGRKLV